MKSKFDRKNLERELEVCKEQIKIQDDLIVRKDKLIAQYEGENKLTTKLNEEKERLEKERLEFFKHIKILEEEIEFSDIENHKIFEILKNSNENNEKLFERIMDQVTSIDILRKNLKLADKNNFLNLDEIKMLRNKIRDLLKENEKCRNDLIVVTAGLDLAYKDELQELIKKNEKANQMLLQYRQEIDEKTTMIHKYQFEILELLEKNNHNLTVIKDLRSQVDKNKIENENLNNQLTQESDKNFSLQNKLINFKENFGKNKLFNIKTIQDLNLQIINQTKELDKIEKELETCTSNLKTCKTENNELKEQLLVCQKGVKSNNEKISTVRSSSRAAPTNPPPSSSSTFSVGQKQYVDSPINPTYGYSNKSLTSQQISRVIIPLSQPDFSNSPQTKRNLKVKLENETKLNTTFFYPFNKTTQQQQICTPLGNNRLTIEQLKKIYNLYINEMTERNKDLRANLKMTSVNKKKPSYQEMCEDLQKLTKQQDDKCKREFIKKVQDAQSSATTTV